MAMMTINDILLTMTVCVFAIGIVSIGAGLFILITRVLGDDLKQISQQTAQLAKKGLAEDVAGLVGNAAALVGSLNNLIKTTAGIGLFVLIIGLILIISSYYLIFQIN
jgi:hypothetical protein